MTLFGNRIFTIRLELRRIVKEDAELLSHWSHDCRAYGEYLSPEQLSVTQLMEQLEAGMHWSEHHKTFLITLKEEEQPIGTIHYWLKAEVPHTAVMAVKIAEPQWRGMGLGTEAQKYLILFLFNRLSLEYVEMYTDINNLAQQRCLHKLGFEMQQALSYVDQQVKRVGYLYRLGKNRFAQEPIYHYHYA